MENNTVAKKDKIPKQLLNSKERREMWKQAQHVLKGLNKFLPVSSIYLLGSFTTAKKCPQDIDVIVLVKTRELAKKKAKWSADFQLVPDNEYGEWMLEECKKWMKHKYGARKSAVIRLK